MLDITIHQIYHYPADKLVLGQTLIFFALSTGQRFIYPVNSIIHILNNWGQIYIYIKKRNQSDYR